MAQQPQPPPPFGAPSRAAAAPPPPPVVDVSKLLNDLAAAGVINAAAPAAAPSLTQPQPQLAMPAPFAPPLSSSTLGSGPHSTLGALGAGGALGLGGGLGLGGLQGSSLGMNDPAISAAVHLLYRDREHAGWRGPPALGSCRNRRLRAPAPQPYAWLRVGWQLSASGGTWRGMLLIGARGVGEVGGEGHDPCFGRVQPAKILPK